MPDIISAVEVFIPCINELLTMCNHVPVDAVDLAPSEASTTLQNYRVKPELGNTIISFHVNVSRFVPIARVEKESIWSDNHYGGHLVYLSRKLISRISVILNAQLMQY